MGSLIYEMIKKVHGIIKIQIETHLTKHCVYMASIEQHTLGWVEEIQYNIIDATQRDLKI
jgi:hypothetical protein